MCVPRVVLSYVDILKRMKLCVDVNFTPVTLPSAHSTINRKMPEIVAIEMLATHHSERNRHHIMVVGRRTKQRLFSSI